MHLHTEMDSVRMPGTKYFSRHKSSQVVLLYTRTGYGFAQRTRQAQPHGGCYGLASTD